ncbi:CZB domain-containing protein [Proteus vulgaris]|uniref:methyl-accepting chemotaxis protein n=1 Tax=Proteus TaxID=583 RepID=UPI000D689AB0|nr:MULTISPECIES: CZB domain-containing protein [Proteus]MBQ0214053.1 CZB domain-containing protein [Proteus vulgaris]
MVDYNSLFIKHTDCNIHTITLIRNSILVSSNKLQDKLNLLEEMEHLFSEMLDNSQSLAQFLNEIDAHFTHSREEIDNFSGWLKKIKDSACNIDRLSNQANILSINSAIEAGHIGREGAGFAVLAQEMKKLSLEIQQQASSIATINNNLGARFTLIKEVTEKNREHVQQVKQLVVEGHQNLVSLSEQAGDLKHLFTFIAMEQFFNTIKLDHVLWKEAIYIHLLNNDDENSVNQHTECRLGKWYYQGDGRKFANTEAFRRLEEPHKLVHECGRLALSANIEGNQEAVTRYIEHMEQASVDVIKYVDALLHLIDE